MCGIAGVLDKKIENKKDAIEKMVACIAHRGPDEDGFFVDNSVGLGMRRLSIIDLSTGKQPISSADDNLLIFFNGEIYNYKELREELVTKQYQFKTHTDTEVILHMFEEYGEAMLPKLRGMFTFCIYNKKENTVFIARDFFGIKPLYYTKNNDAITSFGSEIKSILTLPGFVPEINDGAVYNYLRFQYNPLTETFFKGVYKLPPAHYMKINLATQASEIQKYWQFGLTPDQALDEQKTTTDIFKTIKNSVEHHMIADVPVGSFLSGGVDSSIIASLMQEIRGDKKIKTFTVGFDTLTEGNEARETADSLGTDHTEITIGPQEYFDVLPKAMWHFDEPVADPSAIGLYFVAREARKSVTVVLSGEGADELFGGYNIYLAPFASQKMQWVPSFIWKPFLALPFEFWGKNYMRRLNTKISDWYIGNASIFKHTEVAQLWKGDKQESFSLGPLYDAIPEYSGSEQMQYIDIHSWLVGDILAKADKMTMANSLELRVPFLDIEVSKLAQTLPSRFKWNGGVTKYLLRQAFSKYIPESTRNRKKLGFPTPVRDWFTSDRTDLYDIIFSNSYIQSHMNTEYIKGLIDDHTSGKTDNSRKIYLLLAFAIWHNVFFKK